MKRLVRHRLELAGILQASEDRIPGSVRTVELSGKQALVLVHCGNFIHLPAVERQLLIDLVDIVERFETDRRLAVTPPESGASDTKESK